MRRGVAAALAKQRGCLPQKPSKRRTRKSQARMTSDQSGSLAQRGMEGQIWQRWSAWGTFIYICVKTIQIFLKWFCLPTVNILSGINCCLDFVIFIRSMSVSLQTYKSPLNEVALLEEDRKEFMNPISKITFDALPRIYGVRKKKKYVVKPITEVRGNASHRHAHSINGLPSDSSPSKTNIKNTVVGQAEVQEVPKRFKTEMKSYDRLSADKLSKPKEEKCTRRYCFCNKQHVSVEKMTEKLKTRPVRPSSIRLPQIDTVQPDDYESRHKVATLHQSKQAQPRNAPLTLLDLLRKTHRQETFRKSFMSKPIVNRLSKVQKAQSVHVQTDEVEDSPEAKAEGATVPVPVQSERTQRKAISQAKEKERQNRYESIEEREKQEDGKARMEKIKADHQMNRQISQNSDDNRSVVSSISTVSLSRYVLEGGKKANTMFHSIDNKLTASKKSNRAVAQPKSGKSKFTFQKKNGLFVIPEEEEFVEYLKDYEPMEDGFKIKNLVRKPTFQVVKSEDGVYFGEIEHEKRNGKGIMVTERTIYEGSYKDDLKTYGCERNIDGVYRGQFVNGLREGYGTFQWNNGEIFEGEWRNGTKNGYGQWRSPKGDFYEGEWLLNRQHGSGTFRARLSTYRGQFREFLKHGEGQELFSNGDKYKGGYRNGKPDGKGRYEWADGCYYEGDFVEGLREGKGVWHLGNGTVYEGEFKKDFKEGEGYQKYKSGEYYEGLFRGGSKYEGTLYDLSGNAIRITHSDDS